MINPKLNNVAQCIDLFVREFKKNRLFFGHGTDNGWDEAVYLILSVLKLPINEPLTENLLQRTVSLPEQRALLKILASRIKKRLPAAYLTKEAYFAGFKFYVDKRVLIPRSPIAELILNQFSPWINHPEEVKHILEIGTGSGCIAIACAHLFPHAKITATDISMAALKVAQLNCYQHRVASRVKLTRSNLFSQLKPKAYDIIISNPPYVGQKEFAKLPSEYYHEPKNALVAGNHGDELVGKIIESAASYLKPQGLLIVEVGNSAKLIMQSYPELPFTWLDFSHGESEVLLLTREQCPHQLP